MNEQILMDLVDRVRNRFYGKYRGTVTKVDDGELPRIKAKVPAVLGDQETGWCMPCVPYAGDKAGIAFMPEEGSGVWIEFEGGDVSYPIWVGAYWHQNELPDRVKKDVKVIKTKGNQQIVLDDKDHVITITDSNDNKITLDRNGITIERASGKVAVTQSKVSVNDGAMEVS
jgi:uncharacterized protein involved in type VI secretion and phage assembly